MRYSKRYIAFTIILIFAFLFKFGNGKQISASIEKFRGATLEAKDWNPMIAESVNEKKLTATIDNKVYTNKDTKIYMDDNLNLMIPLSIVRDSYNCSVHLYNSTDLLVEKYANQLELDLDSPIAKLNQSEVEILSPMTANDGEYYVPMKVLADNLDYSYDWNIEDNAVVAANTSVETSILPTSYNLRAKGRTTEVKDQGSKGTCWAFAAMTALESALLPEEKITFSTDNMTLENSFALTQDDGGQYTMSLAYLTAWQGPVLETDDPYDGEGVEGLKPVKHVQEAQIIESKDLEKIKEAVFKYGAVQTSIYSTLQNQNSQSSFYNSATNSYCYVGQEKPNHDVVIVGWDDSYSKDNFSVALESDGAFICQNSWGDGFADNGFFYISYYDTNIGIHNIVYTDIEETDNYDEIYQSDLCGWVGQLGYNKESIYGANVYTTDAAEALEAAGFYATGKNTSYEVYVVSDFTDTDSLSNRVKVAEGTLANAGYYTIPFDSPYNLHAGEKFAIMVKLTTPDAVHPLAIEYVADENTQNVDLTDGEGYISPQGSTWEHVEDTQSCNLCIKAYTTQR